MTLPNDLGELLIIEKSELLLLLLNRLQKKKLITQKVSNSHLSLISFSWATQ